MQPQILKCALCLKFLPRYTYKAKSSHKCKASAFTFWRPKLPILLLLILPMLHHFKRHVLALAAAGFSMSHICHFFAHLLLHLSPSCRPWEHDLMFVLLHFGKTLKKEKMICHPNLKIFSLSKFDL